MDFKRGGQAIQRIRKERGMTQEDLADKSGITSNTVSRIERGLLIPALPTLIDICNALETGADSILAAYITADAPIRLSAGLSWHRSSMSWKQISKTKLRPSSIA